MCVESVGGVPGVLSQWEGCLVCVESVGGVPGVC